MMLFRQVFTIILLCLGLSAVLLLFPDVVLISNHIEYTAAHDLQKIDFFSVQLQFPLIIIILLFRLIIQFRSKNKALTKKNNLIVITVLSVHFIVFLLAPFGEIRYETIVIRQIAHMIIYVVALIFTIQSIRIHRRIRFGRNHDLLDQNV